MSYKIVFDDGKPYEEVAKDEIELKQKLKDYYDSHDDLNGFFDAKIYNDKDEDITESQFIDEMIDFI